MHASIWGGGSAGARLTSLEQYFYLPSDNILIILIRLIFNVVAPHPGVYIKKWSRNRKGLHLQNKLIE